MKIFMNLAVMGLIIAFPTIGFAQSESLDNAKIILMSRSGLADSLIIRKVEREESDFDLSTTELVSLKKAGVSDSVITAMFDAQNKVAAVLPVDDSSNSNKKDIHYTTTQKRKTARIVLDKADAIRNAKTIAIEKSSLHPSRQALEKELFKRPEWKNLNLNIVRLKEYADLYIEIGFVSMSWLTHRYVYRVYDRKSGTVIAAGQTTSWGSLSKNLARGISKRLFNEMDSARKQT